MKLITIVLLGLFAAGCRSHDSTAFVTLTLPSGPQLRFEGFDGPFSVQDFGGDAVITYRGRAIRYEEDALLVDGRRLALPNGTRVIKFDGDQIYFDGRSADSL